VTVTSDPPGLLLTVDGNPVTTPRSAYWDPGSSHTIGASTQTGLMGTQYLFTSWSQGGGGSQSVIAPSVPTTYTARFKAQFKLATWAWPGGSIAPAPAWYDSSAKVSVSATANPGYTFIGFSGDLSGFTTPRTLTIDEPKSVFASFVPTPAGAGPPSVSAVVNGGSFAPGIVDGSWFSVMGNNLSLTSRPWRGDEIQDGDLPLALDGVTVTVGGLPAALSYISPAQINGQVPATGKSGAVDVVVTTPLGKSSPVSADVRRNAPGLFMFTTRYPAALIARSDGGVDYLGPAGLFGAAQPTRPARPGEILLLYATGLGPTNPPVSPGSVLWFAAPTVDPVLVTIGGAKASVQFAGLAGAGLYQINVVVPSVAPGDQPLTLTANGISAQTGTFIAVGQ
jgi:uncharacterized protein (TIGR03437 family)